MNVLLTGGGGFVISVLADVLLSTGRATSVVLVDRAEPDLTMRLMLQRLEARATWARVDIRDAEAVRRVLDSHDIGAVVHGAAVTLVPAWEVSRPRDYLDVNTGGTAAVLEALRTSGRRLRRFVYVSSNAVYGAGAPGVDPQPEAGPVLPCDLYGISKLSSEMLVGRYAQLFGLPAVTVRPGKLFGPMERPSQARALMSVPYHLAAAIVRDGTLTVTPRTMAAAQDWLCVTDAAEAIAAILGGYGKNGQVYNIGYGERIRFDHLASLATAYAGRTVVATSGRAEADLDLDPNEYLGKDAASDIAAARHDLAWQPRDFDTQLNGYFEWAQRNRSVFA